MMRPRVVLHSPGPVLGEVRRVILFFLAAICLLFGGYDSKMPIFPTVEQSVYEALFFKPVGPVSVEPLPPRPKHRSLD